MARALTTKAVERIKPDPKKQRQISDGATGLYLQVQPSGVRSWAFRYRFRGKPRKLTLGRYPLLGLADARQKARDALAVLDQGRDPAAEKQAAKGEDSAERDLFENAVREFIERHAKPRNRAWRQTARRLGLRPKPDGTFTETAGGLVARWRGRPITEITRREVRMLLDDMAVRAQAAGTRGITANLTLAMLRSFFSWAVNHDRLAVSPCAGVKPPAAKRKRERVLSDAEIRWLLQACKEGGFPYGVAVHLALLTGQRGDSEVRVITDGELDLTARLWSIPGTHTKNKRDHIVPLSDAAIALIESLPRIQSDAGSITGN